MQRTLLRGLLAAAVLSLPIAASSARAVMIRPGPVPERVATADAVVVGKVTAIEDKTVTAESFPGAKDKAVYHIASVKIANDLMGAKGLTHIKVGFIKPEAPVGGGRPIFRPGGRRGAPQLTVDQEGLFFLNKHHSGDFYILPGFNGFIARADNENFTKEVAAAKEAARLLAEPKAGLKSKKADERALTAALLVVRYTSGKPGPTKREPISADESKLILQGLADGDWKKGFSPTELTPQVAFGRLGLTEKDGWNPGPLTTQDAFGDAAKAWVKAHADTYRIQRVVSEKKEK